LLICRVAPFRFLYPETLNLGIVKLIETEVIGSLNGLLYFSHFCILSFTSRCDNVSPRSAYASPRSIFASTSSFSIA